MQARRRLRLGLMFTRSADASRARRPQRPELGTDRLSVLCDIPRGVTIPALVCVHGLTALQPGGAEQHVIQVTLGIAWACRAASLTAWARRLRTARPNRSSYSPGSAAAAAAGEPRTPTSSVVSADTARGPSRSRDAIAAPRWATMLMSSLSPPAPPTPWRCWRSPARFHRLDNQRQGGGPRWSWQVVSVSRPPGGPPARSASTPARAV
jgi:hypothetical protein